MRYYLFTILFGLLGLSACGDAGDPTRENNFTPLTSIEITGLSQIANATSTQLRAIGNFSGLFTREITADVSWSSLDPLVATVGTTTGILGRATGESPGSAGILAELDGITGNFTLTVSNATLSSLTIDPLTPTTPKGLTAQFAATGIFSDATTQDISFDVVWESSNVLAATISNAVGSKGLASTVDVGDTTITATFAGTSAGTTMTVSAASLTSIALVPLAPSILNLSSAQFIAIGTFSDASTPDITDQVTWASSLLAIATISNSVGSEGLVSTLSDGFTSISASLGNVRASTGLSVTGGNLTRIQVLPANATHTHISPVIRLKMTAEGTFANASRDISSEVTWSSSNEAAATIDLQGIVTTVGAGSTDIKAVNGAITDSTTLTVTLGTFLPNSLTITPKTVDISIIASNTSLQFTASGDFSDGSTRDLTSEVTWASSDDTVASVSDTDPNKGVASGLAAGIASISADFRGLVAGSDSSDLRVTAPTLVSVAIDTLSPSILPGESLQFRATATYFNAPDQDITADVSWTSADPSVAIFHDAQAANGEILGVDTGRVEITATFEGKTDTVTLVVN